MKAIFSILVVLACLGVFASASTSSSPATGPSSSITDPTATGSSTPAGTGTTPAPQTTTPSGAAFVQCSVFTTMAVATLALLRL